MSAQLFPDVEQVMDVLFSELPDGPYAKDRANDVDMDRRSFSSSEIRAHAQFFALMYESLKLNYDDKFLQTVTLDGLLNWEKELFKEAQDTLLPYAVRRNNLISKLRANGGISLPAIRDVVANILDPYGLMFEILTYSGQFNGQAYGAWRLGLSILGYDTYLGLQDPLLGANTDPGTPLDCALDFAAAGITMQQLREIQFTAYAYEVRIYGVASPELLIRLDRALTEYEPARSDHIIINDASPPQDDPENFDIGSFTGPLTDEIDCGTFTELSPTYEVFDLGGF